MNKIKPVSQDIVIIRLPPSHPYDISWKSGNMALNRFCIDEEMANESSGVFSLKNKSYWGARAKDIGKGVLNIIQSPLFLSPTKHFVTKFSYISLRL